MNDKKKRERYRQIAIELIISLGNAEQLSNDSDFKKDELKAV